MARVRGPGYFQRSMAIDTAALGRLSLRTWTGAPVEVATAWAERPAVLVWLRHFG